MKVSDLIRHHHFEYLTPEVSAETAITYIRSCDLLSWVMARGQGGDGWITVQTHSNIVAVASLLEFSCIILPESLKPDEETLLKAAANNIPLLSTPLDAFEIMQLFCQ
ncbi:MAG: hypothetical protein AVO33_06380 [delta proteobacterium ML8_F1]|nr:MAG: hypothetical protein AVO33_06380 [delta proteobacterium ML8_F1]